MPPPAIKTSVSPFQLDEDLVEVVRVCFRDSNATVVGAFRVHVKTHKQFSHKVKLKAQVLCVSMKPDSNGFKCRISTVKLSANEPAQVRPTSSIITPQTPRDRFGETDTNAIQVRDSWKMKQVSALRAQTKAKLESKPQVVIHFTSSGTETFVFDSNSERSAFLGCVLVHNQKTCQKRIECIDFDPPKAVALWRQAVRESDLTAESEKTEVLESIDETKKEEATKEVNDLDDFIAQSDFTLSNLKGLDGFLQTQLFELDSSNIHAILSNVEEVDGVVGRVKDTLEYVDDLQEWLNVFNTKLTHMRIDISTIEERNNALETKSENNSALLRELQGLQQALQLDDVTLQNIIITNFNESNLDLAVAAARKLHDLLVSLEAPTPKEEEDQAMGFLSPEFLGMRAVKEKKSELKRLKNTWMSRAKTFLISLFSESVDRALSKTEMRETQSFVARAVKEIVNKSIRELHDTCKLYIGLIDVLIMFDPSMAESLAHQYALNVNRLVDRYVKLICARPIHVLKHFSFEGNGGEDSDKGPANSNRASASNLKDVMKKRMRMSIANTMELDKPNEEIPELFAHILDQIMPKICKDCTFCGICFFSKDRSNAGRLLIQLEETSEPDADVEWSDKDAIKSTIKILLKDISGVIFDFINQALKLDDAFSIPFMKLISSWIYRMQGREEHFQTVQWLQEIQAIAISKFNAYMDSHMRMIENPNVFKLLQAKSVKGIWILQYFLKFPRIVEHVECLSQQAEEVANLPETSESIYSLSSRLIEETYCKYSEKSFEALEDLVSLETKTCHADRLRIENYEFYCSSIGSYQMSLPHLSKYFEIASKRKEAAKQRYIKDLLEWSAFADAFRFLYRLENLRKDIPSNDISFQYGFTPKDLSNAIVCIPKNLDSFRTQAIAIRSRIQKHFRNDQILFKQMLHEVFREIQTSFESLAGSMNECYKMLGTPISWDEIITIAREVSA